MWIWTDPPYGNDYVGSGRRRLSIANNSAEDVAPLLASAFALGMDVGALVNGRERQIVTEFLTRAKDENDRHRTHALLIRNGPWRWREHPEILFDRLAAFERGLSGSG